MTIYHTDCIDRPLRRCFHIFGYFIGSHPWWFIMVPLLLSAGLGSGFYLLRDNMSNDIEEQFTPTDGQAKLERRYIQGTFPGNDSTFSRLRLSTAGTYAAWIASNGSNILTVESLQEILDLDLQVRSMQLQFGNETFGYGDVCATERGMCFSNDVLEIIGYNASNVKLVNLSFPWHPTDLANIPLYVSLGGVTLTKDNSTVQSAEAIELRYYLRENNQTKTDLWLEGFINLVSNASTRLTEVSYSTSMSMQWEFEKSPASIIHLFSITYAVAITFSIMSCSRLDNVRSKVWVASVGALSTGLAVLTSFGLLLLLGQPFVMTVGSCPFMILGIGLDDMFIMISCWQRTCVLESVPQRLAATYSDAAVSITITTLTDALALLLGLGSSYGCVRSFCLYAGTSVVICYLYNVTLLGAFVALNGRREEKNRHWLTHAKVPEDIPPGKSKGFAIFCIGGSYDRVTNTEEVPPVSKFFKKTYGPLITLKWSKVCIFGVYAGYLGASMYGLSTIKEGLDIRNLALDDSYIIRYYDSQRQHFSEYSYNVMVAVMQPFLYWREFEENNLTFCIANFESLNYVNGTSAWFLAFQQYANAANINISSEQAFKSHLPQFLELNPVFKQDFNLSADNNIQSSRFFIQTLNRTTMKEMMLGLRNTAEQCPVALLVYHPSFIFFDQYLTIVNTTIQTVTVAVIAMLAVSLVLIPNLLCSLWVAFAICSVVIGVAGFMALWDVSLDSISMINLVMCIGFSVDFSAHVSYAFVSSCKGDVNGKAIDSVTHLSYPILQGAMSTVLGVAVLSLSESYIFRTFFKIIFLVIVFGLVHGLLFIPVFLTVFGACGKLFSVD